MPPSRRRMTEMRFAVDAGGALAPGHLAAIRAFAHADLDYSPLQLRGVRTKICGFTSVIGLNSVLKHHRVIKPIRNFKGYYTPLTILTQDVNVIFVQNVNNFFAVQPYVAKQKCHRIAPVAFFCYSASEAEEISLPSSSGRPGRCRR